MKQHALAVAQMLRIWPSARLAQLTVAVALGVLAGCLLGYLLTLL